MKNNTVKSATGKTFVGQVVSAKMANTIVISLDYTMRHPLYQKIVRRRKKFYAENNLQAKVGDTVKIMECRPLSKLKRFTTVSILK